jgi:glucokinase
MSDFTIGVDVGGTKVAGALVDHAGQLIRESRAETEAGSYHSLVDGIVRVAQEVGADVETTSVGLAIAGNVASDGSYVLFSPHLPLAGEPLARDLQSRLEMPVVIDNDANAAAWAEHKVGAASGSKHLLFVALGTGLGAGLVLDGRMYRGWQGFAGEAGHMTVVVGGRPCPCGSRGCWERYASGTALVAEYLALGGDAEIGGPAITRAAQRGDQLASAAIRSIGEWLGWGLASLIAVLDPDRIVVGGGVGEAGELLLAPAREAMANTVTGGARRPLPEVVPAQLSNEAGVVGAALLARERSNAE